MSSNHTLSEKKYMVVSREGARQTPYPYVYVLDDGSVRELGPDERSYLETPFLPLDGGRPAVKESYISKNGWGSVRGFCRRSLIPENIKISRMEASSDPSDDLDPSRKIQTDLEPDEPDSKDTSDVS